MQPIEGFSQLSKDEKIRTLAQNYLADSPSIISTLKKFWHHDDKEQKLFDEFSENTLSNFYLPFGVAPNFLIDDRLFCIPMVIEESSVVAAAAKSAKFWLPRGGFKTEVLSTIKVGQVHFIWNGKNKNHLQRFFEDIKPVMLEEVTPITSNMIKRGGGIVSVSLVDKSAEEEGLYQIMVQFETCDAMGANFINSVLEKFAHVLEIAAAKSPFLPEGEKDIQVVMAILSNYTPDCKVRCWVECPVEELQFPDMQISSEIFAEKFQRAIRISKVDIYRAATHNKGIFNGIDAVILATGNDFRAVEACGHAYASRNGQYQGLTEVTVENGIFRFSLEMPLALGTVGGITSLHPLTKLSLELLGQPKATDLMRIAACVGLAQNFAAIRSLVTTGIQKGHMKMHLLNILNHLGATESEREKAKGHFSQEVVSFMAVRNFLQSLRKIQ